MFFEERKYNQYKQTIFLKLLNCCSSFLSLGQLFNSAVLRTMSVDVCFCFELLLHVQPTQCEIMTHNKMKFNCRALLNFP